MTCQEEMELMQRYIDRDVSEVERDTLLAHLRSCQDCVALFDRLKRLSAELEQLPKVTPPYSIVDAILPKLDDMAVGPGAARDEHGAGAAAVRVLSAGKHKQRYITWVAAGGVAAAAVVLGLIAFDHPPGTQRTAGESSLFRAGSEAASDGNSIPNGKGDGPTAKMFDSTARQFGFVQPGSASDSGTPTALPSPSQFPSPAGADMRTQEPAVKKQDAKAKGLSEPGRAESGDQSSAGEPSGDRMGLTAPFASDGSTDALGRTNDQAAPVKPPAAEREKGGFYSLMAEPELAGPDGSVAAIDWPSGNDKRVLIRDKDGNTFYESARLWPAAVPLEFVRWESETLLVYKVTDAGAEHSIRIDLTGRKETEIK